MGKTSRKTRKIRPALTPEAREEQLISLATNLAEQQLIDGTASSQVITHYLKMGSTKERLERKIMEGQANMLSAKAEVLRSEKRVEELYADALKAMRKYSGQEEIIEDEEDEDF